MNVPEYVCRGGCAVLSNPISTGVSGLIPFMAIEVIAQARMEGSNIVGEGRACGGVLCGESTVDFAQG